MRQGVAEDVGNGESQTPKALMAAVIIMGVLIIVAVFALIGVIAYRFLHPRPDAGHGLSGVAASAPALRPSMPPTFPLRNAEHVVTMAARPDGLLAVALSDARMGDRIVLWNPETGMVVGELDLTPPSTASSASAGN